METGRGCICTYSGTDGAVTLRDLDVLQRLTCDFKGDLSAVARGSVNLSRCVVGT